MPEETIHQRFRRLQRGGDYNEAEKIEMEVFCANWEKNQAGAFSVRSSFFYSWAGNVLKRGDKWALLRGLPVRQWRFYRLMKYARIASDRMLSATGYLLESLSADQLDIRASIYRRLWNMHARLITSEWREVLRCVEVALKKTDIKPHTRALLHISRGFALRGVRSARGRKDFMLADALIPEIVKSGEFGQLSRVYKHLATFYEKVGWENRADTYRALAIQYARESGWTDQLYKMGVKH
ncbi:MAG: hypothetical protein ACREGH_02300 [Minisyncoccia bacterium]